MIGSHCEQEIAHWKYLHLQTDTLFMLVSNIRAYFLVLGITFWYYLSFRIQCCGLKGKTCNGVQSFLQTHLNSYDLWVTHIIRNHYTWVKTLFLIMPQQVSTNSSQPKIEDYFRWLLLLFTCMCTTVLAPLPPNRLSSPFWTDNCITGFV